MKSGKVTLEEALQYNDYDYNGAVQARALATRKITVEESKEFKDYLQVYALESNKVQNAEEAFTISKF